MLFLLLVNKSPGAIKWLPVILTSTVFTLLETQASRMHKCGDAASSRLAGDVYFAVQFWELPEEWRTFSRRWNTQENDPQELPVLFLTSLLSFFPLKGCSIMM